MSEASPLKGIGRAQAGELALEVCVPLALAGGAWWLTKDLVGQAVPGRPLTPLETGALLGASVALTAWAVSRQLYLYGRRAPWSAVLWSVALAAVLLLALPSIAQGDFASACAELSGEVLTTAEGDTACRVGGVAANAYLPGALLRPAWEGVLSPLQWVGLVLTAGIAALGLRTQRLVPTSVPGWVMQELRLAAAAGTTSALGKPTAKPERVAACGNATLWGEPCGQLYSADKEFAPGERCLRCQQAWRPADREVVFDVVTLFSADVDVLNGLERVDTVSWRQGEPMPPDARVSGQERWVRLGTVRLPDVLTVAQALALVHEQLGGWSRGGPVVERAVEIATARASRVHAWIWRGAVSTRLTYARPTTAVTLAIGSVRLRDLGLDGGEELTLQLDVGLLPLEVRVGFRKTFLDLGRDAEVQNSRQDLWIPVGPMRATEGTTGLWVPRIEGDALRVWLATEQARAAEVRGVTTPRPYRWRSEGSPTEADGAAHDVLDLVRLPLEADEPVQRRRPGSSIAEWEWFEAEQIELLRREALVLVSGGRS